MYADRASAGPAPSNFAVAAIGWEQSRCLGSRANPRVQVRPPRLSARVPARGHPQGAGGLPPAHSVHLKGDCPPLLVCLQRGQEAWAGPVPSSVLHTDLFETQEREKGEHISEGLFRHHRANRAPSGGRGPQRWRHSRALAVALRGAGAGAARGETLNLEPGTAARREPRVGAARAEPGRPRERFWRLEAHDQGHSVPVTALFLACRWPSPGCAFTGQRKNGLFGGSPVSHQSQGIRAPPLQPDGRPGLNSRPISKTSVSEDSTAWIPAAL
ncbi:uncharacterized protein LOC125165623 [Prionailurus viverrinus]|uniref:uncharacterized protein LOC125165623 n=1 Tax=Prionailurus viverrinus TaxID=61388 RepID=UPI001FF2DC13|nr:uncharacterized protein LOC125165623 [Prionailurus viverrinus]